MEQGLESLVRLKVFNCPHHPCPLRRQCHPLPRDAATVSPAVMSGLWLVREATGIEKGGPLWHGSLTHPLPLPGSPIPPIVPLAGLD